MSATAPRLVPEVFSTSRLAEFATIKELVTQTGHPVEDWPLVAAKEAVDNALDSGEEHGVPPVISVEVSTERGEIVVADNGVGIAPEVVAAICDFSTRTSSREARIGPSRGRQGNALQCLIAMPHAIDPGIGETVIIESQDVAHRIRFTIDPIRQEPRISCDRGPSSVKTGTKITLRWPEKACHVLEAAGSRFLPLVWDFVALNPHLAITLSVDADGDKINWDEATNPDWKKWRPTDPIPAAWHNPQTLQRYIAACVNRDREQGKRVRPIRDFIGKFDGLTSTAKRSAVLNEAGLVRAPLDVFFTGDQVDHTGIARLLSAMQRHARPMKAKALGLIGEEHFRSVFETDGADQTRFKYCRLLGEDSGLPFVVEVAFAPTAEVSSTPLISGVNWSAAIRDPFRSLGATGRSLGQVLASQHVSADDAVVVGVHLASPVVSFLDRGKSSLVLGEASGNAAIEAVRKVTKPWVADWEAKQRARFRSAREIARDLEARERAERRHQRDRDREIDQLLAAENDAEKEAKRQRNAIVGTGVLHAEIAHAAEQEGVQIATLLVLSKEADPYFRDTREGHENGQWFADQVTRFVAPAKKIHLRGLFYLIVSAADMKRPDGLPFVNDLDCWRWLQNKAAKAARALGYVPHSRIRDARNEAPRLISYMRSPDPGKGSLSTGLNIYLPPFASFLPAPVGMPPIAQLPYRIIMIGEKSSLAEVLEPIAREVEGELLLPSGEASDTMISEMAARAAADPRPAVLLYISDFDPAGHQMPISVSRKIQALRTLNHPDLRIEVHRIALTLEQVRELDLPSTPLKVGEKRAKIWRERMGHEQTEIDALAALRPGELDRIVREALKPYFDFSLAERCQEALTEWRAEAWKRLAANPALLSVEKVLLAAFNAAEKAKRALAKAQREGLKKLSEGENGISTDEIPIPEVQIEAKPPPPLFTTSDDFITATKKLIASKALEIKGGDDDADSEP